MTKTQQKCRENDEKFSQQQHELRAVILAEFPVGTKVKWQIGNHWQEGIVTRSAEYQWSHDLEIKNLKTGKTVTKEARYVELVPPPLNKCECAPFETCPVCRGEVQPK